MRSLPVTPKAVLIILVAAAPLLAAPDDARAQDASIDAQWSAEGRLYAYARDLMGPGALVGTAAAATVDHVRTDPYEWGDGGEGFARRAASHAGSLVVEQTVRHGLAVALGRSTRYQRCDCSGFGARVGHAVRETFTDRDRANRRAVSLPRLAGVAAAAVAQPLWRPDVKMSDAAVSAGSTLVFEAAGNAVKELLGWPR
jgi:hypothetical protein